MNYENYFETTFFSLIEFNHVMGGKNRPFLVYKNSNLAPMLGEIKQKKSHRG